jgi:hypothetical protein
MLIIPSSARKRLNSVFLSSSSSGRFTLRAPVTFGDTTAGKVDADVDDGDGGDDVDRSDDVDGSDNVDGCDDDFLGLY